MPKQCGQTLVISRASNYTAITLHQLMWLWITNHTIITEIRPEPFHNYSCMLQVRYIHHAVEEIELVKISLTAGVGIH